MAVSRNLAEHAFLPAMSTEELVEVERVLLLALRSLPQSQTGSSYTPYPSLDAHALTALHTEGLLNTEGLRNTRAC